MFYEIFIHCDFLDPFVCQKPVIERSGLRVAKRRFQSHIAVTYIISVIPRRRADDCRGKVLHLGLYL